MNDLLMVIAILATIILFIGGLSKHSGKNEISLSSIPRPDPAKGLQTITFSSKYREVAFSIESDGNAINKAYCQFRDKKDLGNFNTYDEAVLAAVKEFNRQAEDWHYYANFGPP